VIHDASLDRTARGTAEDCTGAVRDRTHAQLLQCDFGSWFNEKYPDRANQDYHGLRILTLEEVISRYGGRTGLYIELKTPELYPGIEAQLVALLRSDRATDTGRWVFVQSFNLQSLLTVREIEASIPLILLIGGEILPDIEVLGQYADGLGLPASAVSTDLVRMAHAQCVLIHPYAGDSRRRELVAMGVDGIFTDRPDLLRTIVDNGDATVPKSGNC
jgi:glycerophosphoryl diester phosphodiesterase